MTKKETTIYNKMLRAIDEEISLPIQVVTGDPRAPRPRVRNTNQITSLINSAVQFKRLCSDQLDQPARVNNYYNE